jgi:hypothetical protein
MDYPPWRLAGLGLRHIPVSPRKTARGETGIWRIREKDCTIFHECAIRFPH